MSNPCGRGNPPAEGSRPHEVIMSRFRRFLFPLVALVLVAASLAGGTGPATAAPKVGFHEDARTLTLTTSAYQIVIGRQQFTIAIRRAGRTVLATTAGDGIDLTGPNGRATAT